MMLWSLEHILQRESYGSMLNLRVLSYQEKSE